jgi:hypothetical protein
MASARPEASPYHRRSSEQVGRTLRVSRTALSETDHKLAALHVRGLLFCIAYAVLAAPALADASSNASVEASFGLCCAIVADSVHAKTGEEVTVTLIISNSSAGPVELQVPDLRTVMFCPGDGHGVSGCPGSSPAWTTLGPGRSLRYDTGYRWDEAGTYMPYFIYQACVRLAPKSAVEPIEMTTRKANIVVEGPSVEFDDSSAVTNGQAVLAALKGGDAESAKRQTQGLLGARVQFRGNTVGDGQFGSEGRLLLDLGDKVYLTVERIGPTPESPPEDEGPHARNRQAEVVGVLEGVHVDLRLVIVKARPEGWKIIGAR